MARTGFVGRHRVALASGLALTVAATAVVVQAISADGYKAHEAELNDGGVWVVNGDRGWSGRINKPINQLDGVVVGEGPKLQLDVVQDGAAVVVRNLGSARGEAIDASKLETVDGGAAAVPAEGDVQMGGGTLASLDRDSGKLWATRYDARTGAMVMVDIDRQSDEVAEVGAGGGLAVSQGGTIVATSSEEGTVTTVRPTEDGFRKPEETDLPESAGAPSEVTTVGERIVTLDAGTLAVLDSDVTVEVPPDGVLQQPGPPADSVLVGTRESLLSVDLSTGDLTTVHGGVRGGGAVQPVRLGACVYGAWSGGQGAVAVQCGSDPVKANTLGGDASTLEFRVNRGEIVLNDARSGTVWDISRDEPHEIDNWEAFAAKKKDKDQDEQEETQAEIDRRPPKAEPDKYGVRPGRTSVLHPLDNDSAPEGRILSIVSVVQPDNGARVSVSPDGQALQVVMPERARPASFEYFVNDGRGQQVGAEVSLRPRADSENERPTLRAGFRPRTWRVPAGGALSVPVLSEWRDEADSDALLLDSAAPTGPAAEGAVARTTAEGRIRFTAPRKAEGPVKVQYTVTDGRSAPVPRTMTFMVQGASSRTTFPPVAEPDVARGEVGSPIEIRPLANDLPGSDPANPQAELALAAKIPPQPKAKIATDVQRGVVTFTADEPGTYFLDYDAAYGYADLSQSKIRVDVRERAGKADPIAMPDTLMLYGSSPALVDVLANDLDPSGSLLAVQRATPTVQGQVDVAIIKGRWLRLSARSRLSTSTQLIRYTVTNGRASASGEVTVTQREQPADNTPVTATDRVVVRAGSAVSAPVLDNDISPSGDRLSLSTDVTERAGELEVVPPLDYKGEPARAFVSGRVVRFVAPTDVAERETFQVPYTAVGAGGDVGQGRLVVTVIPRDARNTAPEPPTLEGRAVAGDVVTVRLPGTEVDAEGDPVSITGITSAPALGRLVSFNANALRYQAYPGSVGTDEFSYAVVDTFGAVATGTVRVAVVPPVAPQPPLAVNDVLTVQPGRTATFDPMANDHMVSGDEPQLELVEAPEGASLDEETGLVTVRAPAKLGEPTIQVVYSLSNGIDESRATMTLRTAEDVENPPVLHDAYGDAEDSERVSVDVLDGAYDPDGDAADIRVAEVYAPDDTADHTATRVTADRGEAPRVIPFRVEDGQGTSSLAQVFVPPRGRRMPYVRPGALIELDAGERFRGRLSDYIVNPSGGRLRLTSRRGVSGSPSPVSVTAPDTDSFEVRAVGYEGPGAVLVEVTTALDELGNEDPSDDSDGFTSLLSIPVQVGEDIPRLDCPDAVIPISAGESHRIDVRSVCKVFTQDPRAAEGLEYDARWDSELPGLAMDREGGSVVVVTAGKDVTTKGGQAVLSLRAGDSNTEQIAFRVARAPAPRLQPIQVDDMKAGETRSVDLAPYLVPGVAEPTPTVVGIEQVSGDRAPASWSGSRIILSPGKDVDGRVEYRVVMSDVDDENPPPERTAEGRVVFEVRDVPSAPSAPTELTDEHLDKIHLGWFPPRDTGGSPIRKYEVWELTSNDRQYCRQNDCFFKNVKANKKYTFKVRAYNDVGAGEWSPVSQEAVVDTKPGRVRNVRMVERGDGTITLAWDKPAVTASKIQQYSVSWPGGTTLEIPGEQERVVIGSLNNNISYTFAVSALNAVGWSEPRESPALQPLGTPPAPQNVTVTDLATGAESTQVRIAWSATSPEGPGPVYYTVYVSANGGPLRTVPTCDRVRTTICNDVRTYDGSSYVYSVRAQNSPSPEQPKVSLPGFAAPYEAVGKPAAWGPWDWVPTGTNNEIQVSYTVPGSRGDASRVEILVDGVVAKPFPTQRGPITTRFFVTSNERTHSVALRLCNEKACTVSEPQNVQSYGPLSGMLDEIAPPVVDGKAITWNITGSNNGNPALLAIRIDGGPEKLVRTSGTGRFSHPETFVTEGYAQRARIQVRLVDDDPAGRGEDVAVHEATSGPPPAPTVTISRAADCTDGDRDPHNNCWAGAPDPAPPCDTATCGFARVTITYAPGTPGTIWECDFSKFRFPFERTVRGAGDSSADTKAYYDSGETVSGTCRFSSYYADVTFTTTFP